MRSAVVAIAILMLFSCEKKEDVFTLQGNAFGTTYSIKYYAPKEFDAEKGIDSVIYAVNRSVSTYLPNSDISKINRGDSTVITDPIFREVFQISGTVYKQSQGYFDPTIGVLRNAYGFGDTKPLNSLSSATIDSLMQFVGFDKVALTERGKVDKALPQIYFDFNAVAKGYGIDLLGRYLDRQGVTDYLIELGGELLAKGTSRVKGEPWLVGVESITSNLDNRSYSLIVALKNEAMASSGNYRKYRIDSITGKKYVHTLNPHTGSATQSDVTSATVIASTCAYADAYATTFMAMGLERSADLIGHLSGVEVYLTYTDSLGQEKIYATPGFKSRVVR